MGRIIEAQLVLLLALLCCAAGVAFGGAGHVAAEAGAEKYGVGGYYKGGGAEDCDEVTAEVTEFCRDFVVGKAPPDPAINGPCCKTLRRFRGQLSCLCGRVDFARLNQRAVLFASVTCLVTLPECPYH